MATLEQLRQTVMDVLTEQAKFYRRGFAREPQTEIVQVFDTVHDHFQIAALSWEGETQIYNIFFHLDIKGEKVWIQVNNTDESIAELLLERGLQKSDIVLGLQPPYKRPYTGYASE